MKISMEEVDRMRRSGGMSTEDVDNATAPAADEVERIAALVRTDDVREDVVAAIKERIENGTYNVTSAEIADLMVRRAYADSIR